MSTPDPSDATPAPEARSRGIGITIDTPAERLLKRSRIAWGVMVIALVFLMETWNVNQLMPNPASPYVWGALVAVACVAALAALAWGRQARRGG